MDYERVNHTSGIWLPSWWRNGICAWGENSGCCSPQLHQDFRHGESWALEEERGGGKVVEDLVYFSLSYSDLIGDKLNFLLSPSLICFDRDGNRW